ncbi:hypothetical protein NQZ68_014900 [Dissostichus eleginoides]|nr:hypothetical protein NQZ68_014900 [Dissostichus eleginoides]
MAGSDFFNGQALTVPGLHRFRSITALPPQSPAHSPYSWFQPYFLRTPLHNGWFVSIIRSSCRLLMSRPCERSRTLLPFSPRSESFPHEGLHSPACCVYNLSVVISSCPASQPALAPFSHVKTPLSSPMFTELLNPRLKSETVSNSAQTPPRCQRLLHSCAVSVDRVCQDCYGSVDVPQIFIKLSHPRCKALPELCE